ncbi:MAG: polysaccharide biosynthesis C-terminal domain-containing protein [Planctomycetes bacterium]|nr:polysaccharide biosynthesis C-terminal domain-containing protein [Planctomycetota bacterium]
MSTRGPHGKFRSDVAWNFASIAVLGVSGILLNTLISEVYGAAALGVFNQVWAAYVFFSQLAVGGIDLSVLKEVAAGSKDRERIAPAVVGALVPTLALAAAAALVFYGAAGFVGELLKSPGVAEGMRWASAGLFFFAVNKVLFGVVNGLRRMRVFAVLQSCRFLLMLAGFALVARFELGADRVAFLFTFAEGVLCALLALEVGAQIPWRAARDWSAWMPRHVAYGIRSCLSGVLMELNSRVDVLMLGYFLDDDGPVGVYSFAALIAEGVFQLMVKLQNNYNPLIAEHVALGNLRELEQLVHRGRWWSWLLMLGVGAVAVGGYPLGLELIGRDVDMVAGWSAFGVLIGGIFLAAGYMPFQQTLLMAGRPGWHTAMMACMVATNFVGNALLIPPFGLLGAALATALAMVVSVLVLRWMVARELGARI